MLATAPSPTKTFLLPDGRQLAYAEFGDPAGIPCFLFHGLVGSRLQGKLAHDAAATHGVRLIAVDRPGFGWSDADPTGTLLDWPDDVAALADALTIQRFIVVGVSAGAGYAAACAYRLSQRVPVAGIVSGVGLLTGPEFIRDLGAMRRLVLTLARHAPLALRLVIHPLAAWLHRHPTHFVRWMQTRMARPDKRVLHDLDVRSVFVESVEDTLRAGGEGLIRDLILYTRRWGFHLEDIPVDVYLWHGDADVTVPLCFAQHAAEVIPRCHPSFFQGEGHLLAIPHMKDIMRTLQAAYLERVLAQPRESVVSLGASPGIAAR